MPWERELCILARVDATALDLLPIVISERMSSNLVTCIVVRLAT